MKEHCLSKEKKEQLNEKHDANTDIQGNNTTIGTMIRIDEGFRDESHYVKLSFLHTTKIKVEASLQENSWLYNEIMVLKKIFGLFRKSWTMNVL